MTNKIIKNRKEREAMLETTLKVHVMDLINKARAGLEEYGEVIGRLQGLENEFGENYLDELKRTSESSLKFITEYWEKYRQ